MEGPFRGVPASVASAVSAAVSAGAAAMGAAVSAGAAAASAAGASVAAGCTAVSTAGAAVSTAGATTAAAGARGASTAGAAASAAGGAAASAAGAAASGTASTAAPSPACLLFFSLRSPRARTGHRKGTCVLFRKRKVCNSSPAARVCVPPVRVRDSCSNTTLFLGRGCEAPLEGHEQPPAAPSAALHACPLP